MGELKKRYSKDYLCFNRYPVIEEISNVYDSTKESYTVEDYCVIRFSTEDPNEFKDKEKIKDILKHKMINLLREDKDFYTTSGAIFETIELPDEIGSTNNPVIIFDKKKYTDNIKKVVMNKFYKSMSSKVKEDMDSIISSFGED